MIRLTVFAASTALLVGCYTLQPTGGVAPEPGTRVAFDVNDIGRVALGGSMGPEIAQIEGRLIEKTAEEYVIAVSAVRLLRGGEQVWSGERVRLRFEHVGPAYERRFSTGRTVTFSAVTVASITAFLITRNLIVSGPGDGTITPPDTGVSLRGRP
jgi:hypothetical protein